MIGPALLRLALIPPVLLVASAAVFCLPRLLGGNVTRSVIRARSLASASRSAFSTGSSGRKPSGPNSVATMPTSRISPRTVSTSSWGSTSR